MNPRVSSAAAGTGRYVCASCRAQSRPAHRTPPAQTRRIHQSTIAKRKEAAELWDAKAKEELAGKRPTMLKFLEDRGYVNQIAGERSRTEEVMRKERIGVYVGIDPTAPSMHVGHLVPFMALFWMYAHGYHTYSLLGGATAQVGDPSGRTTSRNLPSPSRKENMARMHVQLKTIWANVHHHLTQRMGVKLDLGSKRGLLNNNVWLHKLPITEFLRMLGNHTRVGTMLGRETARYKMEHGDGLSFAEFTYPLLQGWDWWQLYKEVNVKMQIGGSDQMGNIMAGKEAFMNIARQDQYERQIDNLDGATPIGFTVPLLTTAAGAKFGKSAGNAIWLDPEMTSVYDQFQFFVRTLDADLERYLKLFTFLPEESIAEIMEENRRDPGKRVAGKALAEQVCLALHGESLTAKAKDEVAALFGWKGINVAVDGTANGPRAGTSPKDAYINPQLNPRAAQTNSQTELTHNRTIPESRVKRSSFPALLMYSGLVSSRTEGNQIIKSGGAYVGSTSAGQAMRDDLSFSRIQQGAKIETYSNFVLESGNVLILRVGKWNTKFVTIVGDQEWQEGVAKGRAEIENQKEANSELSQFAQWARFEDKVQAEDKAYQEETQARIARNKELKRLEKATRAELADPEDEAEQEPVPNWTHQTRDAKSAGTNRAKGYWERESKAARSKA